MNASARQLSLWKSKRQRGVKPKPPTEFAVHCAIADTLERWCEPHWMWWHTPNEGLRTKRVNPKTGRVYSPEGSRLKRMGLKRGVSDFLFVAPPHGRQHGLEVKRKGKKPTPEQLQFGANLIAAGGEFSVVDNYDDALLVLQAWGALPTTITVI